MDDITGKIFSELESASLLGEIDLDDSEAVKNFIMRMLDEESPDEDGNYEEEINNLYEEDQKIRLQIIQEKKKGKYATFHDLLLKGELTINDFFTKDILCKKNIKKHRKEIENCNKCIVDGKCPKLVIEEFKKENYFTGDPNKMYIERKKFFETYDKIAKKGCSRVSSRLDTMEKMQISKTTFEKFYKTRNMKVAKALMSLQKK